MKKLLAILLAALMVLTLAACAKKDEPKPADSAATAAPEPEPTEAPAATEEPEPEPTEAPAATEEPEPEPTEAPAPTEDAKALIDQASANTQSVNALHMDLLEDVDLTMNVPDIEMSQDLVMTYDLHLDSQKKPTLVKLYGTLTAMGQSVDMISYVESDGTTTRSYASIDGGKTWTREAQDLNAVIDMQDPTGSFINWMEHVETAAITGHESIDGAPATVLACTVSADAFLQSMDLVSTLGGSGLEMPALTDLEAIPMTVWVDDATTRIVRMHMEIGDLMTAVLDGIMGAQFQSAGVSFEIEWDVRSAAIDATVSRFDAIDPIVIPEAAKEIDGALTASDDSLVGSWVLTGGEGEEAEQSVSMLLAFGMSMEFTFNEDGTGEAVTTYDNESDTENFTYTIGNGQIVIDGEGADYRIENDQLYLGLDGMVLIFTRK